MTWTRRSPTTRISDPDADLVTDPDADLANDLDAVLANNPDAGLVTDPDTVLAADLDAAPVQASPRRRGLYAHVMSTMTRLANWKGLYALLMILSVSLIMYKRLVLL